MKKDAEVNLLHRERKKGRSQEVAAARAGMSVVTARKYERAGNLTSDSSQHTNPCESRGGVIW